MSRAICVVTGSRAEYGLLRWLMQAVRDAPELTLQILVTASHLSPQHGATYRSIEADGFRIDRRVEMLLSSDTPVGLGKSLGVGVMGCAEAFDELRPDALVVLGDRFEILGAVSAALFARIPVAHLHGGEASEGAYDESIRHAVTKMSHLHFVAAPAYRDRVVQLGESPDRVFVVGGLGVDAIKRTPLLDRAALEASLGFGLLERNLLVTFHPVTLDERSSASQLRELLAALEPRADTRLIFTMPSADTEGQALWRLVQDFVATHENARAVASLGNARYWSCIALCDGVVGNSSSGLHEVPTFRKGTVNIGDRQRGRLRASSVIDCEPERAAIVAAIDRLYSPAFRATLADTRNPYGDGGASERIVQVLRDHPLDGLVKKSFHDVRS